MTGTSTVSSWLGAPEIKTGTTRRPVDGHLSARALKVRDVMSPAPIAVPTTATLVEAAQRMRVADVGDVLVLDDDRACGLITDRDIVVRAIAMNYRPDKTTVDEICSHDLVSVPSDSDIEVANALMRERSVRNISASRSAVTTAPSATCFTRRAALPGPPCSANLNSRRGYSDFGREV